MLYYCFGITVFLFKILTSYLLAWIILEVAINPVLAMPCFFGLESLEKAKTSLSNLLLDSSFNLALDLLLNSSSNSSLELLSNSSLNSLSDVLLN